MMAQALHTCEGGACGDAPVPLECPLYLFGNFQIPSFFHMFCAPWVSAYAPFDLRSSCSVVPKLVVNAENGRKFVMVT